MIPCESDFTDTPVTCPYIGQCALPSTTRPTCYQQHVQVTRSIIFSESENMSSTATQTRERQLQEPAKRGTRGRGGRRGGSKAARGKRDKPSSPQNAITPQETSPLIEETVKDTPDVPNPEASTAAICWICAEPVKYYSVSACNHRTCHICALRLRALYKKLDCTFCKVKVSSTVVERGR